MLTNTRNRRSKIRNRRSKYNGDNSICISSRRKHGVAYRQLNLKVNLLRSRYLRLLLAYQNCIKSTNSVAEIQKPAVDIHDKIPKISLVKHTLSKLITSPSKKVVKQSRHCNQVLRQKLQSSLLVSNIRQLVIAKPMLFTIVLPWLVALFYLTLLKSPIYESSARILIEKNEQDNGLMINLGFLGQSGQGGGGSKNTALTKEFILSRDMYQHLNKELRLKEHFQSNIIDFPSRLSKDAKDKKIQDYYKSMIEATIDPITNEISIYTRAYDPIYAYRLNKEVIEESRVFANRVSNSLAAEQYGFTEKQLKLAKNKLYKAEKDILAFQNQYGMFDPEQTVKEVSIAMAKMKGQLIEKQTSLIALSSFMDSKASKIIALKKEVLAIKDQIKKQTEDLLGKRKDPLNSLFAKFSWLKLNLKFAGAEYEASQQALNIAKVNLNKQQDLVIEVLSPQIPDDSEYPRLLLDLFTFFIALLVFYAIGRMSYIIVQEHID
jgi:capsular polysaccharide transport system permease protein